MSRALALVIALAAPALAEDGYWLRPYAITPYRQIRSGTLTVKAKADVAKVVAAIEKRGGALTQPLEVFAEAEDQKQLSFAVDRAQADALAKDFKKLGGLEAPAPRSHGTEISVEEIREKLARLRLEKTQRAAALAQAPTASEVLDEMIARYSALETQARGSEARVLWNLTVRFRK